MNPPTPSDSRATRSDHRSASLISILRTHRITLPANAMEWRTPPEETLGTLPSLQTETFRLLCTDGIVAWFIGFSTNRLFFGHLENFEAEKREKLREFLGKKKPASEKAAKVRAALEDLLGISL